MKVHVYVGNQLNVNGEMTVYISVFNKGRRFMINSGIATKTRFKGREFPATEGNNKVKTMVLGRKLNAVEEFCLLHEDMPPKEMKKALFGIINGDKQGKTVKRLYEHIDEFGRSRKAKGTVDLYRLAANKVRMFDSDATLDSMDERWLERFEERYLKTMSINGFGVQMRCIRATFNWANKKHLTSNYPFKWFSIKSERTRKRALTPEQFALLRDYQTDEWQTEYRDMFLLMVYLCGINAGDLFTLPKLTDGRCVYHRKKTGRLYDIAVQPEALEIINRYRGKKHLLDCLDNYKEYKDYLHKMNDGLKKIGTWANVHVGDGDRRNPSNGRTRKTWKRCYSPLFPDITTYWARHTWATTAALLDIPEKTIGMALGHADASTASIYIDFDMRKIDEANRKVIDYLNSVKSTT